MGSMISKLVWCGALLSSTASCGGDCIQRYIGYEGVFNYGADTLELRAKEQEVDATDWDYTRAVAHDISEAPAGRDTWGVLGSGRFGVRIVVAFNTPQPVGATLVWDPLLESTMQDFAVLAGQEELSQREPIRVVTEASAEIRSASPTVIGLDLLFTPVSTSSSSEAIRMTGEIRAEEHGNAEFCGS